MSKYEKLLAAIRNNPKDVSFEEIRKLLEANGYTCDDKTASSHCIFRKENAQPISIPKHKPIKAVYVKQALQLIEQGTGNDH